MYKPIGLIRTVYDNFLDAMRSDSVIVVFLRLAALIYIVVF